MTNYSQCSTVVSRYAHTLVTSVLFNPHSEAHETVFDLDLPRLAFIAISLCRSASKLTASSMRAYIHSFFCSFFQQNIVLKNMHSEIRLLEFETRLCQLWDSGQVTSLLSLILHICKMGIKLEPICKD